MRQINLLPTELKPSRKLSLAFKRVEKYFIFFIAVYLLLIAASIGSIYYLNNKLKDLQVEKTSLSSELKSLTSVETSTVYIRDRVQKYLEIKDKDIEKEGLDLIRGIIPNLPANVNMSDFSITENHISFSASSADSYGLSKFLEMITNSDKFSDASILGLSYTKDEGYSFSVSLNFI